MKEQCQTERDDLACDALARRIVAVIPTLNEEAHIEQCINDLLMGEVALQNVQFIIADGGSTDKTVQIVERLAQENTHIKLVHNPDRIQAVGVNLGAKAADEERTILVRCDAHAVYPENYLLRVARGLDQFETDSLVVPMDAVGASCFQKANAWVVDTPLGSGGSAHRGGTKSGFVDHGHHAAFRRDVFLGLGGYDATFSHNEDAEYDARLRASGGKVYLDAETRIGYFPREDLSSLWKQYFGYGQGRARNLLKNGEAPRLRQLAPVAHVVLFALSLLLMAFIPVLRLYVFAYLALLAGTSVWLSVRNNSLCGLWAGAALAAMHIAWGAGFIRSVYKEKRMQYQ